MADSSTAKTTEGSPLEEITLVRDAIAALTAALKSHSLYPENHSICLKSLSKADDSLRAYHARRPSLRVSVKKDKVLYRGEPVHQGPASLENWAFVLFRDGVQWIDFQEGLTAEELRTFLKILVGCRKMTEDTEGDLVTALWEADLPHLRYKAVELNWETEPLDLSLPTPDRSRHVLEQEEEGDRSEEKETPGALQTTDAFSQALTPSEEEKIQEMILEEENRDTAQDLLDVVLAILEDLDEESVLAEVLSFLEEEFRDILLQGDFLFAREFLGSLRKIQRRYSTERAWAAPHLNRFFAEVSSPGVLNALSEQWATMDALHEDRMKLMRQTLLLLTPEAVLALGPMLPQIRSSGVQRQLMEVIAVLASRNIGPLARLLDRPEEGMVQRLVFIVGRMKGEKSAAMLEKMVRHPSEKVRRQALKSLLAREADAATRFFRLIEDPGDSVRRLIFDSLGQRRDEKAEDLLLDYLGQRRFRLTDPQHLAACFRTLGRCGSSKSIPFLKGALMERGWLPDFGRSVQREGAATALALLKDETARALLKRASRSLLPSVRIACRKALKQGNEQRSNEK